MGAPYKSNFRLRKLLDHLRGPLYQRWIIEEVLYPWILDSVSTELANRFIEYETVKEIRDAAHKYHSKKNDKSKITQLVTKACTLQQGDKSVLAYANELSSIFSELDHYWPPGHNTEDREYILMNRVYKILPGLRPEFEGIRSQLHNLENTLNFDNAVSQLLSEESQLQEIKGGGERAACAVTSQGGNSSGSSQQMAPPSFNPNNAKKAPNKNK